MAQDRSGGANPTEREREAAARAGRKTIGVSGRPQDALDGRAASDRPRTDGPSGRESEARIGLHGPGNSAGRTAS